MVYGGDNIGLESSPEQRLSDQASTYDPRFQIPRGRSAYEVWNYNDVSMNKLTTKSGYLNFAENREAVDLSDTHRLFHERTW